MGVTDLASIQHVRTNDKTCTTVQQTTIRHITRKEYILTPQELGLIFQVIQDVPHPLEPRSRAGNVFVLCIILFDLLLRETEFTGDIAQTEIRVDAR